MYSAVEDAFSSEAPSMVRRLCLCQHDGVMTSVRVAADVRANILDDIVQVSSRCGKVTHF